MTADELVSRVTKDLIQFNTMLKDNPENPIVLDRIDYDKTILRIVEENKRLRKRVKSLGVEE